jgi:hypothetical protein
MGQEPSTTNMIGWSMVILGLSLAVIIMELIRRNNE